MEEMTHLASMEMHSGNSNDIEIFLGLLNEVLQKVPGIQKDKFNPRCFLSNEGGANYKAVQMVYGEEFCHDSIRGCQFNFKQQVQKKKHEVPEEHTDEFIKMS